MYGKEENGAVFVTIVGSAMDYVESFQIWQQVDITVFVKSN
jgi:hypothetical protein